MAANVGLIILTLRISQSDEPIVSRGLSFRSERIFTGHCFREPGASVVVTEIARRVEIRPRQIYHWLGRLG
jgi:hypothetical protein